MDIVEIYDRERTLLREELHNLKNCQVTFLTSSVTATGVLLGLAATFASTPALGVVFLLPLIVLLPSWWIFFDKATTITRIVGYYRVLEKLILGDCEAAKNTSWENGLREFRNRQESGELNPPEDLVDSGLCRWFDIFLLRTTHRYWVITYYTFLVLSGSCLAVSIATIKGVWFFALPTPTLMVLISALWNARVLRQLIYGRYSYDCNEYFWNAIVTTRPRGGLTAAAATAPSLGG